MTGVLRGCPFCGSAPEVSVWAGRTSIRCIDAGCSSTVKTFPLPRDEAYAAWNTRDQVAAALAGAGVVTGRMLSDLVSAAWGSGVEYDYLNEGDRARWDRVALALTTPEASR